MAKEYTLENIEEEIRKLEEIREKLQREKRENLLKEKDERKKAVDTAYATFRKLREEFVKDYGDYTYKNTFFFF